MGDENNIDLKSKLATLEELSEQEISSDSAFKQKLDVLKDIAFALIEEVESLEYVRHINLRRGIFLHEEVRRFEVHLIQSALERTGGHQTRAAQLLGISLTTLNNKLKRHHINLDELVDAPVIHEETVLTTVC